jgi:hypothetical protein
MTAFNLPNKVKQGHRNSALPWLHPKLLMWAF